MPVSEAFYQTLIDAAQGYLALGWSVVPLLGDTSAEKPKAAAVAWESFQRRRASESDVADWFERRQFGALGIVTGAVSQLVVLDFDDDARLRAFERACPELLATRTVTTRRGQHLYFHLPPTLAVRSRKLDGVDLLAGGCYAVAPPSVISGHAYALGRGGRPKSLTQRDLDQIAAFLDSVSAAPTVVAAPMVVAAPVLSAPIEAPTPTASEPLIVLYRALAQVRKRNIALFQTACYARDRGWAFGDVVDCLSDLHAAQLPSAMHSRESDRARRREALATIRSAYTRAPRPQRAASETGLYNSLREKLFQLGQTCVVRVLEGLRLAGFKAGQQITENDAFRLLSGLIGRRSIRAALRAFSPQNESIFSKIPPLHPTRSNAATPIRIVSTLNADVGISKRVKKLGRPSLRYEIPSLERLCALLGVSPSGSDPLTRDDLQTAPRTRLAAHRELIRRRPGLYQSRWLGARLGVSAVTLWRYTRQSEALRVTPTFTQTPIHWWNLSAIPPEDSRPPGVFLEDDRGKRWPAIKGLAMKLLGQGRQVRLLAQTLSYYWCGGGDPPAPGLQIERAVNVRAPRPDEPILTFAQRVERLIRPITPAPSRPAATAPISEAVTRPKLAEKDLNDYANTPKKRRKRYWKPLAQPDAEALAQRVYAAVNRRAAAPELKISLVTARLWVDRYSASAVDSALRELARRGNIQRPAGFMATLLRSAAREARLAASLGG